MATYLKQHYLRDHKLAQRALLELSRAMKSGRLIAFTGAMTTEAFGYGSWVELKTSLFDDAISIINNLCFQRYGSTANCFKNGIDGRALCPSKLLSMPVKRAHDLLVKAQELRDQVVAKTSTVPDTVSFTLLEEILDRIEIKTRDDIGAFRAVIEKLFASVDRLSAETRSAWPLDDLASLGSATDIHRLLLAMRFRYPRHEINGAPADFGTLDSNINVPLILHKALGIRRFATLNFDFELERTAMLPPLNRDASSELESPFSALTQQWQSGKSDRLHWNLGSGNIRALHENGLAIESDILNRERIDRLFEFAIGTDDVETHIMHMHGRACSARSMLVSYRDYDRLYRHNDLGRLPFEHAKRVLMGGNPILFVGLGMTEAEVNREMEEFISNSPYRRVAPTFLLWNTDGGRLSVEQRRMKRLDWLRRLGVLTIFDTDLQELSPGAIKFDDRQPENLVGKLVSLKDAVETWRGKGGKALTLSKRLGPPYSQLLQDHLLKAGWRFPRWQSSKCRAGARDKIRDTFALADKSSARHNRTVLLKDLGTALSALPDAAKSIGNREEYIPPSHTGSEPANWRSMAARCAVNGLPVLFWGSQTSSIITMADPSPLFDLTNEQASAQFSHAAKELVTQIQRRAMVPVIGATGAGRGWLARQLAEGAAYSDPEESEQTRLAVLAHSSAVSSPQNRLLIHGSFSFDTDSMLNGICEFLDQRLGLTATCGENSSRSAKFQTAIARPANAAIVLGRLDNILIVINGMDRFFGIDGHPLSAELDDLLQRIAHARANPRIRWVFLGSNRIRDYFENQIGRDVHVSPACDTGPVEMASLFPGGVMPGYPDGAGNFIVPSLQMAITWDKFSNGCALRPLAPALHRELRNEIGRYHAQHPGAISGDLNDVRRAFYALCLDPVIFDTAIGANNARNAMSMLRALAFIGAPTEASALIHAPRIWEWAGRKPDPICAANDILTVLLERGLVLQIAGFPDYTSRGQPVHRYALHRSLMAELRQRSGIPLSEAKLSTAFNMSLFIAQPIDGFIPEPEVHDELGEMIDSLIGAYKDEPNSDPSTNLAWKWHKQNDRVIQSAVAKAFAKCDRVRAARSTIDDKRLACFYRLCLPESVQALRAALAVIRGFYATSGILTLDEGDRLIRADRDGILLEHAERLDTMIDAFGKLMQARAAVWDELKSESNGITIFKATFGDAGPFYADELVWLHNERGVVRLAMGDLYEAKRSFELAMAVNRKAVEHDDKAHNWRRIRLNQLTVDIERGEIDLAMRKIEEIRRHSQGVPVTNAKGDADHLKLREDRLACAITDGYEGFCLHLRGHRKRASKLYDQAIESLDDLDELRGQAYFARMRGDIRSMSLPAKEAVRELDSAHDLALAGRQLDIAYRIQVAKASAMLFSDESTETMRRRANRLLEDAMRYALQTDTYRVRCEAAAVAAKARLANGDLEGALSYAVDALTVATRYGLELRKMTLRALIGRILAARGHPLTAEHLAMTCIAMASRQKIQTAIDQGEACLQEVSRISGLMTDRNMTGRRDY